MSSDQDHLAKLIRTHERHLHMLEQQIARFELGHVPVHLLLEREDLTAEVTRLRGEAGLIAWAALPADSLPSITPLPLGSRMPFSPNPLFVGRQDALKALARTLQLGGTAAIGPPETEGGGRVAAATGLGGIGKSQLACEFAHRYGQFFGGGVFWLSFAEAASVPAEVAVCGRRDCLSLAPDYDRLDLPAQLSLVRAAWSQVTPRLLIFDNCEDEALLAEWRPVSGGCRVLLTSRRSAWDPALGVAELPLKVLPRPDSLRLLLKFRPDLPETDPALGALSAAVGDLPLALHLIGSYLKAYKGEVTPEAYLAELRGEGILAHESLAVEPKLYSPTGHDWQIQRTLALSYNRLDPAQPDDELALSLLLRASYFASGEPISRDLLFLTINLHDDKTRQQQEAHLTEQMPSAIRHSSEGKIARRQAVRALTRLVELGLIETDPDGGVILHRLVTYFVRQQSGTAGEAAQLAVETAVLAEAERVNQTGYPGPLLAWQSHLRFVAEAALVREGEQAAYLSNELGYHLRTTGDHAAARPYLERALAICEKTLGLEHPDTAQSLNNLGMLLKATGDYIVARPYLERALAIREKALGPEHPATAQSLNNLGALLDTMGDYIAARPYYERALAICEKTLGPEHSVTANSLNNLGYLFRAMGDHAAARPYYERALAIREKALGPEHPDTANSLNNVGALLDTMGDHATARLYYERALAIREKALGPEHPDTANSLNNVGALLDTMGDHATARFYYERALTIFEKALGPEHPATALSLNNLGYLLKTTGDYAAARLYYERALAIFEKALGPEHPHTTVVRGNLAGLT